MDVNFNTNDLTNVIGEIDMMCKNVFILYNEQAKGNQELTNLANLSSCLLWNCSKSMIALKLFFDATTQCEIDFAIGQLCVTINECIKQIIGFNANRRRKCLWVKDMGEYISKHPEIMNQYNKIKDELILYASSFEKNCDLEIIRNIATHGVKEIEELIKIRNMSISEVSHFLAEWGNFIIPAANFSFTCFENECQQEMNRN